jgi:hypothetical protein
MYYIGIDPENTNKLTYYCRNCNYVDETLTEEGVNLLTTQIKTGEQEYSNKINEYTKLDPTLPRLYNTKCPNKDCETKNGVIYMRYDKNNLKYIYLCVDCDVTWKTDERR